MAAYPHCEPTLAIVVDVLVQDRLFTSLAHDNSPILPLYGWSRRRSIDRTVSPVCGGTLGELSPEQHIIP